MAAQRGTSPSAVIGLDCEVCAYFFDDALVFRQWYADHAQVEQAEHERAMQAHIQNARRMRQANG